MVRLSRLTIPAWIATTIAAPDVIHTVQHGVNTTKLLVRSSVGHRPVRCPPTTAEAVQQKEVQMNVVWLAIGWLGALAVGAAYYLAPVMNQLSLRGGF